MTITESSFSNDEIAYEWLQHFDCTDLSVDLLSFVYCTYLKNGETSIG